MRRYRFRPPGRQGTSAASMTPRLASAAMPLLRGLDPETAHRAALWALRAGLAGADTNTDPPVLAARLFGRDLPNPLGLAAGFDKDAVAVLPLFRLGFALVEAGTTTPRPQYGNRKPRLFRLAEDRAVINRMGMNNQGVAAFAARLAALPRPLPGLLGANVGINKDDADPERDYPDLYEAVAPHADYVTINLSSPNTPGLRDLQSREPLLHLLESLQNANQRLPAPRPLLLKIAPDMDARQLDEIADIARYTQLAGLIATNTTLVRSGLRTNAQRLEAIGPGGLSGAPLRQRATEVIRHLRHRLGPEALLIGVGGIDSPQAAQEKFQAGADLVQVYTGLIYEGPGLVRDILTRGI